MVMILPSRYCVVFHAVTHFFRLYSRLFITLPGRIKGTSLRAVYLSTEPSCHRDRLIPAPFLLLAVRLAVQVRTAAPHRVVRAYFRPGPKQGLPLLGVTLGTVLVTEQSFPGPAWHVQDGRVGELRKLSRRRDAECTSTVIAMNGGPCFGELPPDSVVGIFLVFGRGLFEDKGESLRGRGRAIRLSMYPFGTRN